MQIKIYYKYSITLTNQNKFKFKKSNNEKNNEYNLYNQSIHIIKNKYKDDQYKNLKLQNIKVYQNIYILI